VRFRRRAETRGSVAYREVPIGALFTNRPSPAVPNPFQSWRYARSGASLCIVEAMKTEEEIDVGHGRRRWFKKRVANGQPIEYGQERLPAARRNK